jgi:cyanate lyase
VREAGSCRHGHYAWFRDDASDDEEVSLDELALLQSPRSRPTELTRTSKATEDNVTKLEMQSVLLAAKKKKGISWEALGEKIGLSELFVASCCYGENSMTAESADKLCAALDLGADLRDALTEFPTKGNSLDGKIVPTDPLLYRFYEILCVYGTSMKDAIQEKCGDGIMSAIDFTLDVKKVEHPKGDRIVVTMDGKFLAYRRF